MGLHINMLRAKQAFSSFYCDLLYLINIFTTSMKSFPWISFNGFDIQNRTRQFQYTRRRGIFRGYKVDRVLQTLVFFVG